VKKLKLRLFRAVSSPAKAVPDAPDLVDTLRASDERTDKLRAALSVRSDIAPAPPRAAAQHAGEAPAAPDLASVLTQHAALKGARK
jgi:hypothetical protein